MKNLLQNQEQYYMVHLGLRFKDYIIQGNSNIKKA